MNPFHSFLSKKDPVKILTDKDTFGKYSSENLNLMYLKDVAHKRNLIYLGLVSFCVVACVLITTTYSYKTYVVRVDNATGQVEIGGELKATNYKPQEAELKHFLRQFILDTRSVPLDPVEFTRTRQNATHFITQEASAKYAELMKGDNPRSVLGKSTVTPEIKSIQLQPGSQSTYQVRWTENEYNMSGQATNRKSDYVALFAIEIKPPSKEDELLINPLGLYIKDLAVTRERQVSEPTTSGSTAVTNVKGD